MKKMKFRNDRMLLYIGMADAYALAAEYLDYKKLVTRFHVMALLKCKEYMKHPRYGLYAGQYSDDTEMSCANTRALLSLGTLGFMVDNAEIDIADAWVAEFLRGGKRNGYASGLQSVLNTVTSGAELIQRVGEHGGKSVRNGAAMRAVPFGVIPDKRYALLATTIQARITHDSPEGRFSARAVALMSHFGLYEDAPLAEIGEYCLAHLPEQDVAKFGHVFKRRWTTRVEKTETESVAITTVNAAVELVSRCPSLMRMLETAIAWGGDTDSVAAIAWGIASARFQDEQLPEFLARDLENGSPHTGAPYLIDLGTKLMDRYDTDQEAA